jgi:hypothetical protein
VPPIHQVRLTDVMAKIDNRYGSSSNPSSTRPINQTAQSEKPTNPIGKNAYDTFKKSSYTTPESIVFKKQIRTRGGFGGVIFGNEVIDATNLPKLNYIRVIQNGYLSKEGLPLSDLEFIFEDGSEYLETLVLVEDLLAANEILFHSDYNTGEGIGLAGIKNPIFYDNLIRWESVIHPALSNFELGWSALSVDALPIASNDMIKYVKKNNDAIDTAFQWVLNSNLKTWKIIDIPLVITNQENKFLIERSDKSALEILPNAYITMHGFYANGLSEGEEVSGFYETIPALTQSIYEFSRINDFARTLALLRWAKEKGGILVDLPKDIKYVQTPETIFITEQKNIRYYSIQEEKHNFEILKKTKLDKFNKIENSKKHFNYLQNIFQNNIQDYNKSVDSFWRYSFDPLQYQSPICSTAILSPNSEISIDKIIKQLNNSLKSDSLYGALKANRAKLEKIDEFLYFKSLFLDNSPKSLKIIQEIKNSISYSENLYLKEYEKIDAEVVLTSNEKGEISYMMFQKDLILISIGNLNDEVGCFERLFCFPISRVFQCLIGLLQTENTTQRCTVIYGSDEILGR